MRIVAGFFLFCLVLAAGCSDKDNIPSGVLGKEEMEKVMWDMMLADQYSANYLVKDSSKVNVKLETLKLYEEVFRLHNISKEDFSRSLAFYQSRPDITRVLFDSLMARGTRARMENYNRPPGQGASTTPAAAAMPRPIDSIRNRTLPNGRPPVLPSGKTRVNTPAMPGGARQSAIPPGVRQPGTLPPGAHTFLNRDGRILKAGEVPFKQVKKDSVPKGRQ